MIDKYIAVKRTQNSVRDFVVLTLINFIVKFIDKMCKQVKDYRMQRQIMFFQYLKIVVRFKIRQKRFGKNMDIILNKKMKNAFLGGTILKYDIMCCRAGIILLSFISRAVGMKILVEKIRLLHNQLKFISRRIRASVKVRHSKIEVLQTKWERVRKMI